MRARPASSRGSGPPDRTEPGARLQSGSTLRPGPRPLRDAAQLAEPPAAALLAPDHQTIAGEIVRVTRPGGTVALASWTPDGFIGEMFRVLTSHVPAPTGVASPMLWGTE